ncbi:SDR family NAD(P)-dependent oxidoreductase [Raineyella fluvialis]|uniref:SDR family NAD(P)-dependent oxidoreductase n=1 Tax=Raineyella fluvialis TaxID=2662261 RepID=A0A5Q2FFT4_9ACTN|nr:SDR family NAD(P)-dependent oxidoreductase [Raineyella fluvialis]QGF23983.1 SDR family NAD(P)-dependent oxidoreductase [Raineyella fluvialis]
MNAPATPARPIAVVTGASSGIGAATARTLAAQGYEVICAARREERLREIADEIGGHVQVCDVTDEASVQALAAAAGPRVELLVNNAGGALGLAPVEDADLDNWQQMYDMNVLGAARVTRALTPALLAAEGGRGQVVFVTSVAADGGYEGGAGYCGAKAAERAMTQAMRLEMYDRPLRVVEIAPGMVRTDFSLVRFDGDQERADKVYQGVEGVLTAEDVASCIGFVASLPAHVNIDRMVVRPRVQPAAHKILRAEE